MNLFRKKLKSAGLTLAVLFVFSVASIVYSMLPSSKPTAAPAASSAIIIAYRDAQLLEKDLNYFNSLNLSYSLPGTGFNEPKTNISIIIEMRDMNDVLRSVKLLKEHCIPATIALFETMNESSMEMIRNIYCDVHFALHYYCSSQDCIEFCTDLSNARLEYYMNFRESCDTIVLGDGSRTIEDIGNLPIHLFSGLTIIGFGNGVNSNFFDKNLYNRIVRIPELSMQQYFSEIVH